MKHYKAIFVYNTKRYLEYKIFFKMKKDSCYMIGYILKN